MSTIHVMKQVIESSYPISFRQKEADELGKNLKHHRSVVLVGMKRVGISNFLRFFLNHEGVGPTYIRHGADQIFIQVDLNDLIERNIFAFWTLLLTRVVDSVQSSPLKESLKRQCRKMFVQSIQLKDPFFTVDSLRKSLQIITGAGYYPTLFIIRFDRLADVVTPEVLSNLLGLRDAVKHRLSYVFTSYRPLHELAPEVFKKQFLTMFSRDMYLPPCSVRDMRIIMDTLEQQYHTDLDADTADALIEISGGYVQYLQLALIRIKEERRKPKNLEEIFALLAGDEQIQFQSEELYDSLTKTEQDILSSVSRGDAVSRDQRAVGQYLWNTGIIRENHRKQELFSRLFATYVRERSKNTQETKEFTKKEHLLFTFLKNHENELCEREAIIQAVWPEHEALGVSDWAIDRLVARLRTKLKSHGSSYQIVTVVTRGYKLIQG